MPTPQRHRPPQPAPEPVRWHSADGWQQSPPVEVRGLLPGSFNPLHEGHQQLQQIAAEIIDGLVAFELSTLNVDKPPLEPAAVEQRCRQFAHHPVAVTSAPTFVEKSSLFPGVTFVVGADTAARIVDPRFYRDDNNAMHQALERIAGNDCRFLVAARWWEHRLLRLDQVPVPSRHRSLFAAIPEGDFRLDIRSSDLRRLS